MSRATCAAGGTLEEVLREHPAPWPPGRAVAAVVTLCLQLDGLHEGPEDRLPDRLKPEDLEVSPEGFLTLARPGPPRPRNPLRSARVMGDVGALVQRLVDPGAQAGEIWWILARCGTGDPSRCYPSFLDLAEALERCLADHAPPVRPQRRITPVLAPPPRRPPVAMWLAAAVLALAGGAGLVVWWLTPPGWPAVHEPAVALAAGPRILLVSQAEAASLGALDLGEEVGGLAATRDGSLLVASLPASARLVLVDLRRGRLAGFLQVDGDPRGLAMDEHCQWLFVTHPAKAMVSIVRLAPRSLPDGRPRPGSLPAFVERVLAVDRPPLYLAHGHDSPRPVLYVAGQGSLTAWRLEPLEPAARVAFDSPGPLALSPGGRHLYVSCRRLPQVAVLDARTLAPLDRLPLPEAEPRALMPCGQGLWALLRSGEVVGVAAPASGAVYLPSVGLDAVVSNAERRAWVTLDGPPRLVEVSLDRCKAGRRLLLEAPAAHLTLVPVRR